LSSPRFVGATVVLILRSKEVTVDKIQPGLYNFQSIATDSAIHTGI
jgi:hypothetical protein